MTAWALTADVVAVTGQSATAGSLALAQSMVEIFAGTTEASSDAGLISARNLNHLRKAVAFQAVWLDAHPDVLEVMDVRGISQDGLSAEYAHAWAHLCAPLARMSIMRLTWKHAPLRVRRPRRASLDRGNRDSAVRDDEFAWTPVR